MDKNLLNKVLIFAAGAAVGSLVTWKLVETKYKKLAQEEIDSVKEAFGYSSTKTHESEKEEEYDEPQDDEDSYDEQEEAARIIRENGYDYTAASEKEEEDEMKNEPYVISPDEFDEMDYKVRTLTYYDDDVLTDENGKIIHDAEKLVGTEALKSFGQYEDDSVFVRNDALKTDYEILADARCYHELYQG